MHRLPKFLHRDVLRPFILIALALCLASTKPARSEAPQFLTIREALDLSNEYNPNLKAASARESATRSRVGIAQSNFYPTVALEAVDSSGFPGSTGSSLGMTGLIGSPFRSGFSAGAVLKQDVFDFGRTYFGVKASKLDAQSQERATEINTYQVEQEVLQAYFDCALNRTEIERWQAFLKDTELVERQVEIFIKTGQRSIVDRYLSRAQRENANTHVLDFQTRESASIQRLAVLIGIQKPFACPLLNDLSSDLQLHPASAENPIIAFARIQLDASEARLDQAKAENLPIILGIASAGYLQDTHVVQKENYSLGVGIRFPLFEGFRIKSEIDRNSAQVDENFYLLQNSQFVLKDLNRQYDEKIRSADTRRTQLVEELKNANEAFTIAKRRYFDLQGTLVDLRDSVSNLERVVDSLDIAQAEYLQFTSLEAVLNGAR